MLGFDALTGKVMRKSSCEDLPGAIFKRSRGRHLTAASGADAPLPGDVRSNSVTLKKENKMNYTKPFLRDFAVALSVNDANTANPSRPSTDILTDTDIDAW